MKSLIILSCRPQFRVAIIFIIPFSYGISTLRQESVREHYPFLTSKARLRALLRQNENITNKDVLQLRRI
jgi:hypothetical protein